jgi:alkanesulfonate monooxygenase SsuD/methylene tetrahydromethanopterin reductase-like flavin-dependent oxidoreductase (luciferase family)
MDSPLEGDGFEPSVPRLRRSFGAAGGRSDAAGDVAADARQQTYADPDRVWTVREIAKHAAVGGRGPVVVGSPEEVAEELIAWVEETDVDGFNLAYAVMPETFADFVDLVVPELQRRGRYKRDYAPGTLREKFYGRGRARLGVDHPAVRFRSIADLPGS